LVLVLHSAAISQLALHLTLPSAMSAALKAETGVDTQFAQGKGS
jgi:hypothetical protein